jgi:hypothetical protein
MSFDNKYPNRKDWRKDYYGGKRRNLSCRTGGSCGWCREDRTISATRRRPADEKQQLENSHDRTFREIASRNGEGPKANLP